ncbi:MAG TPA: mechanosensitive ion channel family protein [Vicinamibacterales bacterium]|nr:mechanosensitive ion channel family protein [Vicinamibacterales bacterium]
MALAVVVATSGGLAAQQVPPPAAPTPAPAAALVATPVADALGRSTPRGTVTGFLAAARRGDNELARQYLDTGLPAADGQAVAHELFVVLDARLPARLTGVSDAPEGSRANPLQPNQEAIGTIESAAGDVPIVLERISRPKSEPIWLFSRASLEQVPVVYGEITQNPLTRHLPSVFVEPRLGGIRPYEWLALLLGMPVLYFITVMLDRGVTATIRTVRQRRAGSTRLRHILPVPARLLLMMAVGEWLVARLPLSLLVRQVIWNGGAVVSIVAIAWLVVLFNGYVERRLSRRLPQATFAAGISLLRVGRRVGDILVIFLALLAMLRVFGVDPTPVVAGLGVGGLAVALAAQKTLENVIAGASLIFDQAVRIGDYLKVSTIEGTVEHIGLRSTRIRTPDRSIVTVPNAQIASMSLETVSARDKFWFHPILSLRHDTTPEQLRTILANIREALVRQPMIEAASVRVRFLRVGTFSLDVEVVAYALARDWPHFLEIQEQLLFAIAEIIRDAGSAIAIPAQATYLEKTQAMP